MFVADIDSVSYDARNISIEDYEDLFKFLALALQASASNVTISRKDFQDELLRQCKSIKLVGVSLQYVA